MSKPKVAFIGTGGTMSSLGVHPLELQDYGIHNNRLQASGIVDRFAVAREVAEVIAIDFRNVPSTDIYFAEWQELAGLCAKAVADHPDLGGIVVGHGTASLEETAYFLNLVLKLEKVELTAWFTLAAGLFLLSAFVLSILWSTLN